MGKRKKEKQIPFFLCLVQSNLIELSKLLKIAINVFIEWDFDFVENEKINANARWGNKWLSHVSGFFF
jgi:hypothetical protein